MLCLIIGGCLLSDIAGILELLEEAGLHDCVQRKDGDVNLDAVVPIEALLADLRVLQLLLEVSAEVLVFVAAKVRSLGI